MVMPHVSVLSSLASTVSSSGFDSHFRSGGVDVVYDACRQAPIRYCLDVDLGLNLAQVLTEVHRYLLGLDVKGLYDH